MSDVNPELASWVWIEREPTPAQMIERLASLPPVWGVKTVDYADFVLPMENRQKVTDEGVEKYVNTVRLYMQVAGRVRMLNDAQESNSWSVSETQEILPADKATVLRLGISIMSVESADSIYVNGNRFGMAKAKGGDTAWEKMETAARGRALGAWGFGVLPGSGIATLEEMQDALTPGLTREERAEERDRDDITESILAEIENLRQLRSQERHEINTGIVKYIADTLGKDIKWKEDDPLDLSPLKAGQLLLLERQVRTNVAAEERRQEAL